MTDHGEISVIALRRLYVNRNLRSLLLLSLVLIAWLLQGCSPSFRLGLDVDGRASASIDQDTWQALAKAHPEALRQNVSRRDKALLLERLVWSEGIMSVESIQVGDKELAWGDIHANSWLTVDGRLILDGQALTTERLGVTQPWETGRATHSLCDLAPTLAGALGVRSPQGTSGRALGGYDASRVLVISIDGFGARFFSQHRRQGTLKFLDTLGDPRLVQGMYPSNRAVNLVTLLTGAKPEVHGVQGEQDGTLLVETLLGTMDEAGLGAVLLGDGASTPLLTALGVQSVEDSDGNDVRTEELIARAEQIIASEDPAFLWLNFSELYQRAQEQGPDADAAVGAALFIDQQLERLVMSLPSDSLVVILGGHGMHATKDQTSADCGSLLPEDMYVPLWLVQF